MTFVNILPSDLDAIKKLARSEGRVEISFQKDETGTQLKHLFQSGCGRVRFPSVDNQRYPEAVMINTAGGLTGGDVMTFDVTVHEDAELTVTGQAAEKIYKSIGPDVSVQATLQVDKNAYLEWLPQETILFDQARLKRVNKINLTSSSRLLAVEATVLGRLAHGEIVRNGSLIDGWEIRQENKLVWYDRFRFEGHMDNILRRPALLDGAKAFATIVVAAPETAAYVEIARKTADTVTSRMGVTSFEEGLVIIRLLDKDPQSLRKSLVYIVQKLRKKLVGVELPMPAVWET